MTKYIETTGKTEELAVAAALEQLGLDRDDVSVEVLARAKFCPCPCPRPRPCCGRGQGAGKACPRSEAGAEA